MPLQKMEWHFFIYKTMSLRAKLGNRKDAKLPGGDQLSID